MIITIIGTLVIFFIFVIKWTIDDELHEKEMECYSYNPENISSDKKG